MKIQDFCLSEDYKYWPKGGDPITVPAGTFVKPIQPQYIPKHILEKFTWFSKEKEIFIYSSYGMFPVPNNIIREK